MQALAAADFESFFNKYEELEREMSALTMASHSLEVVNQRLATAHSDLYITRKKLRENHERQGIRIARIAACQSSWLFGCTLLQPQLWLRGGVRGKIARQRAKLDREARLEPDLASRVRLADAALRPLAAEAATLEAAVSRRQAAERQRRAMFATAVAAHPTSELFRLLGDISRRQQALVFEQQHAPPLVLAAAAVRRSTAACTDALRRIRLAAVVPAAADAPPPPSPYAAASPPDFAGAAAAAVPAFTGAATAAAAAAAADALLAHARFSASQTVTTAAVAAAATPPGDTRVRKPSSQLSLAACGEAVGGRRWREAEMQAALSLADSGADALAAALAHLPRRRRLSGARGQVAHALSAIPPSHAFP
mmetsp:Transcript_49826/g.166517  ORF Transcript_49826/g.166517 Transcript_49826/m.166517 type:complete len:367 (-) Transcript_49826:274-1374(-)